MALTPAQQQLADVAQAGEASACCTALGGDIIQYGDDELCSFVDTEYPLGMACGQITASLPSMESPGQESSGGFFNWLGNNFTEVTGGIANVVDSITGNQPVTPPPIAPAGSGVGTTPPPSSNNTVLYIIGGAMLLLVVFLLIRKKK